MSEHWTDTRIEQLKADWADGKSAALIASRLGGVTRNAVIGKVNRLGLNHRKNSFANYTPKPKRKRAERQIRKSGADYVQRPPVVDAPKLAESLEEVETSVTPPTFLGIALMKLQPHHCRYPRGEGLGILFCGQPKLEDSSYCRECHRRCHAGFYVRRAAA